jgi:hypothetical protein
LSETQHASLLQDLLRLTENLPTNSTERFALPLSLLFSSCRTLFVGYYHSVAGKKPPTVRMINPLPGGREIREIVLFVIVILFLLFIALQQPISQNCSVLCTVFKKNFLRILMLPHLRYFFNVGICFATQYSIEVSFNCLF